MENTPESGAKPTPPKENQKSTELEKVFSVSENQLTSPVKFSLELAVRETKGAFRNFGFSTREWPLLATALAEKHRQASWEEWSSS